MKTIREYYNETLSFITDEYVCSKYDLDDEKQVNVYLSHFKERELNILNNILQKNDIKEMLRVKNKFLLKNYFKAKQKEMEEELLKLFPKDERIFDTAFPDYQLFTNIGEFGNFPKISYINSTKI